MHICIHVNNSKRKEDKFILIIIRNVGRYVSKFLIILKHIKQTNKQVINNLRFFLILLYASLD